MTPIISKQIHTKTNEITETLLLCFPSYLDECLFERLFLSQSLSLALSECVAIPISSFGKQPRKRWHRCSKAPELFFSLVAISSDACFVSLLPSPQSLQNERLYFTYLLFSLSPSLSPALSLCLLSLSLSPFSLSSLSLSLLDSFLTLSLRIYHRIIHVLV